MNTIFNYFMETLNSISMYLYFAWLDHKPDWAKPILAEFKNHKEFKAVDSELSVD